MSETQNEIGTIITILKKKYRVPDHVIDRLRVAFTQEAIKDSSSMRYDRILTAMAVAAKRCFPQFGAGRIARLLQTFDQISGEVQESEDGWSGIMEELDRTTGIVVQDNPNRFVAEYRGHNWRRQLEILEAEKEMERREREDNQMEL